MSGKPCRSDLMLHPVASDLGLHYLLRPVIWTLRVNMMSYPRKDDKWRTTNKKGLNAICGHHWSRSACAFVPSDLGIFCSLTYTSVSTDSVSGQKRPRACVVHKLHKGPFCTLSIKCLFSSKNYASYNYLFFFFLEFYFSCANINPKQKISY